MHMVGVILNVTYYLLLYLLLLSYFVVIYSSIKIMLFNIDVSDVVKSQMIENVINKIGLKVDFYQNFIISFTLVMK